MNEIDMACVAAKERPLILAAPMVRAVLEDRKTQHRVPCQETPPAGKGFDDPEQTVGGCGWKWWGHCVHKYDDNCWPRGELEYAFCHLGKPGDRLWIRETWLDNVRGCEEQGGFSYRADHLDPRGDGPANPMRWWCAACMPRRACRIVLEITDVRIERLQAITEADAIAEGVERLMESYVRPCSVPVEYVEIPFRAYFAHGWDKLHGKGSWDKAPWVWALSFRRVKPESS